MLRWIPRLLCASLIFAPLSAVQAAPIEVVAFDGQNGAFQFVTFGQPNGGTPAVDDAGRVFFDATIPNPGGGISRDFFVSENGVISPSTRTFPRPSSLPVVGDPVPGNPGVAWTREPGAKLNRNGLALIDLKVQPQSIPAGVVVYDSAGTGNYLASDRDAAPGTGGRVFSGFNSQAGGGGPTTLAADLNDRGDIVFEASLGRVRDDGEINDEGFGIWTRRAGAGSIAPLVLSGTTVPGVPDRIFHRFTRTEIDAAGRIAFIGDITDPTEQIERALFFAGPGGDIVLAARQGDLLPGGPNDLRVSGLDDLFLNDAGLAVMTVDTTDASGKRGAAVVSVTADGKLELLLRTGQEILIGDSLRKVSRFSFWSSNLFQRVNLPDFGPLVGDWLTLGVEFTTEGVEGVDGQQIIPDGQAILRIRVPEPAISALLLLALATLRRRAAA